MRNSSGAPMGAFCVKNLSDSELLRCLRRVKSHRILNTTRLIAPCRLEFHLPEKVLNILKS